MSDLYGNLWVKQHGTVGGHDFMAWSRELDNIPIEKIINATRQVVDAGEDYPVNLIRFLRYCRNVKHPSHYAARLLPPPIDRNPKSKQVFLKEARSLGYLS